MIGDIFIKAKSLSLKKNVSKSDEIPIISSKSKIVPGFL